MWNSPGPRNEGLEPPTCHPCKEAGKLSGLRALSEYAWLDVEFDVVESREIRVCFPAGRPRLVERVFDDVLSPAIAPGGVAESSIDKSTAVALPGAITVLWRGFGLSSTPVLEESREICVEASRGPEADSDSSYPVRDLDPRVC